MRGMRMGTWLFTACAMVLLAGTAVGGAEDRLDKARTLYEQAEPLAKTSFDPDLDAGDRKSARDDALRLLKQARDEFQAWQAANGEDADNPIGQEIGSLLYLIRKMSGIGGSSGGGPSTRTPDPPKPPKPPGEGPGTGPGPVAPPTPPAPPDPATICKDDFARLQELEKSLKSDIAALKDAYEQFLADHPETAFPEYTKAAIRLGQLQEQLAATFKKVVQRDPDGAENLDSKATPTVMARLKRDLNGKDPEARRNAAKLLGLTRSGAASYALVIVLRDDDAEVARLAMESLIAIGGTRTADNLAKQFRNGTAASQNIALDVLEGIARKGTVDARTVSPTIGRFALSNDGPTAKRALDFLVSLGWDGGPGLVVACETNIPDKRLYVIDAIAKVKYLPGSFKIATLLDNFGAVPTNPALVALKEMGVGTTPYLIRCLSGGGKLPVFASWALRDITGQSFGTGNPRAWKKWWDENGGSSGK